MLISTYFPHTFSKNIGSLVIFFGELFENLQLLFQLKLREISAELLWPVPFPELDKEYDFS
jgi:hypothetical protein